MKTLLSLIIVANVLSCSFIKAEEQPSDFLGKYCVQCHGMETQKADRRFDNLSNEIKTLDELERYQEVVDQLNLESMPPETELQPTAQERALAIEFYTNRIGRARTKLQSRGGHSILRRLNSWEYRQTLGELLGLNVDVWNPAEDFPEEVRVDGFDNNGAELVTSGRLMEHYFEAAEEAIRRATHFKARPETKHYAQKSPFYFNGKEAVGLVKLFQVDRFRFIPDTPYTDLYGRHYRGGHIGFLPLYNLGGVSHSGIYTIRVKAAAISRVHEYGDALGDFRNGDPLVMEIAGVDRRGSVESTGNVSRMVSLARIELTNTQPEWFEWDVYLEAGFEPEVRFRNGPLAAKRMVRVLTLPQYDLEDFRPFIGMKGGNEKSHGVLKAYQGPRLRIWEVQVAGPHLDSWPPSGHQALYGGLEPEQMGLTALHSQIKSFATHAFRRPPTAGELEPFLALVEDKLKQGVEPLIAYQIGCQAILCSPGFLYLNLGEGDLDEISLASRLSYFLWSSPPDTRLLEMAAAGQLKHNLAEQVIRMLDDPRASRFVQHFVRRWLDLDNIGTMPPAEDFLVYYRDNLEQAMREETESFFNHIMKNNLPLSEFLDANYSFLNRELALHYGITDVQGNHLQRVELNAHQRGGILGHGSFLTASANGVDTSPVVRGIYVLEKLLGYSPPPPPPDVPAVEPDIRGASSIRELLEKHRGNTTCAECHRKIDPLGFALENFDAVGKWREKYKGNLDIDAAGELPGGGGFTTLPEFRRLLLMRTDQFNRCLTEKLLTYALGRQLGINDRPEIDHILDQLDENSGLRDLIRLIVTSETFQRN
ncbi:MAG: DUF1592 domain-containing protein [Pirellulales bacterium]|nr:DUF1592 domain-containing protein [Pirellulales bacterium]